MQYLLTEQELSEIKTTAANASKQHVAELEAIIAVLRPHVWAAVKCHHDDSDPYNEYCEGCPLAWITGKIDKDVSSRGKLHACGRTQNFSK